MLLLERNTKTQCQNGRQIEKGRRQLKRDTTGKADMKKRYKETML